VTTRQLLFRYTGRRRGRLALGLLLTGAGGLVSTIPPLFVGSAIDELGGARNVGVVLTLAGLIVAVTGIQVVLQAFGRLLTLGNGRDIEYEMRNDLYAHLERMHLAYYQHQRIGDLMARLTNDLNAVRTMISGGFLNLVKATVVTVGAIAAMLTINVGMTVISLVLLPLASIAFIVIGRRVNHLFRRVQAQFGDLSAAAQENFSGIRVVKAFGQEPAEIAAFAALNQGYLRRALDLAKVANLMAPLMEAVVGIAVLAAIYLGGQEAIRGRMTIGQIVQFVAYVRLLAGPMQMVGGVVTTFQTGWASLGRLREIVMATPGIVDAPQPIIKTIAGEIELRHVTVRHDSVAVLDDVSVRVAPGRSLAIVGPTGAGKTTLVSLIPRLLDPFAGHVLVDGVDVKAWSLEVLRRSIGIATQDPFLFSASLRDDIGLGRTERLTDEELARVGDIAQLTSDVAGFPAGYETVIGERGVTLSGGQKQRVSLARAIARTPRILILDDALSAVDTATEAAIQAHLRALPVHQTRITVAHRISSVKDADEILVLDRGRVVERGNHASLLALGGWYARMYRRQLLEAELDAEVPEVDVASAVPEASGAAATPPVAPSVDGATRRSGASSVGAGPAT
jgi:ATP-binding cassette subfamily B multidrug efflux pump